MIKNFCKLILAATASAALFISAGASAQTADTYQLFGGGTAFTPPLTTNVLFSSVTASNTYSQPGIGSLAPNTNLWTMNVAQFDYVGLTWAFTGTATSTNDLLIFKSYDKGLTFETVPSFQYLGIAPGAAAFETNGSLDVHGVTTLAFVLKSRGTTYTTNNLLEVNLKSPKYGAKPATQ